MARYRKAVSSDDLQKKKTYSLHVIVIDGITSILMYFNSTLNPFLYYWKVKEVRQAENPTSTLLSMNLDIFSGSRQVQDHVKQKPSQTTALNMARYRKAVSSAVWVQLALVACYVLKICNAGCDHLQKILYSTLNPFLYCWKVGKADNPTSTLLSMDSDIFLESSDVY